MKQDKKPVNFKRTLYYFWRAMMTQKLRTILMFVMVPVWIFISNVAVPFGISEIVGKLSSGDFEIGNYIDILSFTVILEALKDLVVIRIVDWNDLMRKVENI